MGRKISSGISTANISEHLKPGEILTDLTGKQWVIGKPIGVGGFGEIYLVADVHLNRNNEVASDSPYVAKIENHSNGPLFVEINCYLRIAKQEMIEEWKQENGLTTLGMPHYVASGSHLHNGNKYRFLILPRYQKDLESVLEKNKRFNLKTVLTVSMQIIDTLEYIHGKGYVHSDIKASNILLGRAEKKMVVKKSVFCYNTKTIGRSCNPVRKCRIRNGRRPVRSSRSKIFYLDDIPDFRAIEKLIEEDEGVAELKKSLEKTSEIDQVYLLDYGLASKYRTSTNTHKPYCNDERKAHMGTMLFCSRDAHKGAQSRRSDLECLAFNIVYWLAGCLPWQDELHDPTLVEKRKQHCMSNVDGFLKRCLGDYPEFLLEFFEYLKKLNFEEKPDYTFCKKLFRKALKDYGYKNDNKFDFNNCEGWGEKKKKVDGVIKRPQMTTLTRLPLHSNFSVKSPKRLRGNINKQLACLKWSKILIDPEVIIKKQKKSRERKLTEPCDLRESVSVLNLDDISELNPTYAMIEVFSKSKERLLNGTFGNYSPAHKSESELTNVEGYTPAMMAVLARMKENQLLDEVDTDDDDEDDSENEYYYKFPEPVKKSTTKPVTRKSGSKRKATTSTLYTPPKTRIQSEKKVAVPAKRVHRLRG